MIISAEHRDKLKGQVLLLAMDILDEMKQSCVLLNNGSSNGTTTYFEEHGEGNKSEDADEEMGGLELGDETDNLPKIEPRNGTISELSGTSCFAQDGDLIEVLNSSSEILSEGVKTGARRKTRRSSSARRKSTMYREGSKRMCRHESIRSEDRRKRHSTRTDSIRSDIGPYYKSAEIVQQMIIKEEDDAIRIRLQEFLVMSKDDRHIVGQEKHGALVETELTKAKRRRIVLIIAGVAIGLVVASVLLVTIMIVVSPHIDEIGKQDISSLFPLPVKQHAMYSLALRLFDSVPLR